MRTYKVLLPLLVGLTEAEGGGSYGQGETFEKTFTAADEAENVASGLLAIVPSEYKVVGGSRVHETDPGGTFTAALPLGQEELLVAGGQIERVEVKRVEVKPTKKAKEAK